MAGAGVGGINGKVLMGDIRVEGFLLTGRSRTSEARDIELDQISRAGEFFFVCLFVCLFGEFKLTAGFLLRVG